MLLNEISLKPNQQSKTKDIKVWLNAHDIQNYKINSDGTVDVNGNVDLIQMKLDHIPVQFGHVTGSFDISMNWLTSLKGCPREVGQDFYCNKNKLKTLEGGPREVAGNYSCGSNPLTSLRGAPREVGNNFGCMNAKLTSLDGAPREIGGGLFVQNNKFKEKPDTSRIHFNGRLKWESK